MQSTDFTKKLLQLQDLKYRDFQARLMPNISKENIIGVRVPALRALAREYKNTPQSAAFIKKLPHRYYDENNLHAFLVEQIKDFDTCVNECDRFLPYVDNWATCDMMRPKVFGKNKEKLLPIIDRWLASERVYTVRFAIEQLMGFYLDESFEPSQLKKVADRADDKADYYVKMMVAWYFATALAKQYKTTLPYLEKRVLPPWIHAKTIQKAVESNRLTAEQKAYLKSLK